MAHNLNDAANEAAATLIENNLVGEWMEGAILPRELVFFFAKCRQENINIVLESGRQDGYSTKILALLGRKFGMKVYSVDFELDKGRADKCRQYLQAYPEVTLVNGNAFSEIGKLLKSFESSDRVALLLDGPKGYAGFSICIAAAKYAQVVMMSMHNISIALYPDLNLDFKRMAGKSEVYYEDFKLSGSNWNQLSNLEEKHVSTLRTGDYEKHSTLAIAQRPFNVSVSLGARMSIGKRQPFLVSLRWMFV